MVSARKSATQVLHMRNFPNSFQVRTLWNAATGVSILILGLLTVGLIWLVGKLFGFLQPVLIPVIVAGIIAYLLDPVVRRLQRWNFSRLKAVVTVFIGMLVAMLLLVLAILPGVNQARAVIAEEIKAKTATSAVSADGGEDAQGPKAGGKNLPSYLHEMQQKNNGNLIGWALTEVDDQGEMISPKPKAKTPVTLDFFWDTRIGRILFNYKSHIWQWTTAGTSKILGTLGFLLGLVMVPIYLFFFLKDSTSIEQNWHEYVPLKASRFKNELVDTLKEINGYLISFFRGQVLVAFIDGILVGIALTFYGLPYGFLIGVFMAMLGVIPYIGNILCLIPACIIAWFHGNNATPFGLEALPYTVGVVIIFVVVQQINSLVTAPKIVGDSVGLHPMTVIFSMIFWTVILGGFAGALLAVPLTAAIKVLFRRFIWEKKIKDGGENPPLDDPNADPPSEQLLA
jgi:predicted PurR-regulated permease PerM